MTSSNSLTKEKNIDDNSNILRASNNRFQEYDNLEGGNNRVDKQFPGIQGNKNIVRYTYKQQNPKYQLNSQSRRKSQIPDVLGSNYYDKIKSLNRVKYINKLAQLDYEQKALQLYTKHSKVSKQTINKKIKAKNQVAQFIQEDNFQQDIEQLKDYKYGKSGQYHFEQDQKVDYVFCDACDTLHNDHLEVHNYTCKNYQKTSDYFNECLQRIKLTLKRLNCRQAQQLFCLIGSKKKDPENISKFKQICELNKKDKIMTQICKKIQQCWK